MKCPECSDETKVVAAREDHIYPELFPGIPTFWRFISPTFAGTIMAIMLVCCVALILLAVSGFGQGLWLKSAFFGLLALFWLYVFVVCVRALKKHQLRKYYKCNACGLEWAWSNKREQ